MTPTKDRIICAAMTLDDVGSGTVSQDYFYSLMEKAGEQAGHLAQIVIRGGLPSPDLKELESAAEALWVLYKSEDNKKLARVMETAGALAARLYRLIERV